MDCIIIGTNQPDFNQLVVGAEKFKAVSGAIRELKTDSVKLNGTHLTYIELLNHFQHCFSNRKSPLNLFEMPNLAVSYLSSYLKRRGYAVDYINFFNREREKLSALLDQNPLSIAVTTTFYYFSDDPIRQIIAFIRRRNPEVKIIVGGPRIFNLCNTNTPFAQDIQFKTMGADIYVNDAQGEKTLQRVIDALKKRSAGPLGQVPNLIIKDDAGGYLRTSRMPEDNDMDAEAVDWSLFPGGHYVPIAFSRTVRGCPFSCAFCTFPKYAGKYTRMDIATIEREMDQFHRAGVKYVLFVDDSFNFPVSRFKEICKMMIRNNYGFQWVSFFRASHCDEETFDLMARSGGIGAILGIESGDQAVLDNMNKKATLDRYRYAIDQLNRRRIMTLAALIIGFPGETEQSVRNTIRFLEENPTTFYQVRLFYYDKFSPIHDKREQYGIKSSGYSWEHNTMNWETACVWKEYMIRTITRSIYLTTYVDLWAIPYLLDQGLNYRQLTGFFRLARQLLLKSLVEPVQDMQLELNQIEELMTATLQPHGSKTFMAGADTGAGLCQRRKR